jgi:hypothetical protein
MKDRFALKIEREADDRVSRIGISVEVKITDAQGSNLSGSVPLFPYCDSYRVLEKEVAEIKEELDTLLEKSKRLFEKKGMAEEAPKLDETMSAREIWDLLSTIKDPEVLSAKFNGMSYQKRIEVADHVLAHCNVFSGAASIFSMRYNSEEGLLE